MATELPLGNITSANCTMILTVKDLFPAGVHLQMFSVDGGIASEEVQLADTRMSLDGHMVVGYIPTPVNLQISLEPASPSYQSLCQIYRATVAKRGWYECQVTLICPDLNGGTEFVFAEGVMVAGTILPAHRQLMEPTQWNFRFEKFYSVGG